MGDLAGKVAVITGAGSGIGRAAVVEFLTQGAEVVAVDLSANALEETRLEAGRAISCIAADVSEEDDVGRYVEGALETHGRIDVLFNNAGIFAAHAFAETPLEVFDRLMKVNVRSVFLGTKAVLPHMIEREAGAIVNNASVNGVVALPAAAAYTASKHAVIGLTRAAAVDAGPYGVRVNAICPALGRTPMLASLADEDAANRTARRNVPLGRTSDPVEHARVACFLASDRASYVNGEAVLVDGGFVNCRLM